MKPKQIGEENTSTDEWLSKRGREKIEKPSGRTSIRSCRRKIGGSASRWLHETDVGKTEFSQTRQSSLLAFLSPQPGDSRRTSLAPTEEHTDQLARHEEPAAGAGAGAAAAAGGEALPLQPPPAEAPMSVQRTFTGSRKGDECPTPWRRASQADRDLDSVGMTGRDVDCWDVGGRYIRGRDDEEGMDMGELHSGPDCHCASDMIEGSSSPPLPLGETSVPGRGSRVKVKTSGHWQECPEASSQVASIHSNSPARRSRHQHDTEMGGVDRASINAGEATLSSLEHGDVADEAESLPSPVDDSASPKGSRHVAGTLNLATLQFSQSPCDEFCTPSGVDSQTVASGSPQTLFFTCTDSDELSAPSFSRQVPTITSHSTLLKERDSSEDELTPSFIDSLGNGEIMSNDGDDDNIMI